MKTPDIVVPKFSLLPGFLICASLITYFMFMKYFNLTHITTLRFLNFFILTVGLAMTFRSYRMKTKILNVPYLDGLLLGAATTLISVVLFSIFIYLYFSVINPLLLQSLKGNAVMMGTSLTALTAAATVLVEGVGSGIIISFSIMQYYKSGFYRTLQEKKQDGVPV